MNTAFRQVLQIELLHSFYKKLNCNDFSVFAVSETQKLLRNRQAIFSFKQSAEKTFGKLLILENVAGTSAEHPIEADDMLVFGMELQNPVLANITVEWPAPKKIFLYTNVGNLTDPALSAVTLIRSEISLRGKCFTHTLVSNDALTLEALNEKGAVVESFVFAAGNAGREQTIDLQRQASGLFTIREKVGVVNTDYIIYADDALLFRNIFALIRIVNQSAFPFNYDGKPIYQIRFTAKSSSWKYYVVAPNLPGTDAGSVLSIEDTGRTGPSAILFTKTYPILGTDKIAPMLFKDLSKVVLFTSNSSLVFEQTPRQKIELRKGALTLIENLPNPDISKQTTEMFIYV
jgi:hypothetical protein